MAAKCSENQVIIKISKAVKLDNNRDLAIKSLTCFVVWVFGRFFLQTELLVIAALSLNHPIFQDLIKINTVLIDTAVKIRFPKKSTKKPLKKSQKAAK